jgi:transposase
MRCLAMCLPSSAYLADHPLRAIRALVDDVLRNMSREFDGVYARVGRPSIPPERLLRAQLLQIFYSIRSERLLMEHLDYNLLFAGSSGWTWTNRSGFRRSSVRIATGC